jgi:hypothetical protein
MLKSVLAFLLAMTTPALADALGLIDDCRHPGPESALGTTWRLATDRVMGGVSEAQMTKREINGRAALCLNGRVSLENNGGFVQMLLDLAADRKPVDASAFDGIRLIVRGDGADYNLHLKTPATTLPWQSYRATFGTDAHWREQRLPFAAFAPYRLDVALDPRRLARLGIVAIGRAMTADVCIAEIGFYAD